MFKYSYSILAAPVIMTTLNYMTATPLTPDQWAGSVVPRFTHLHPQGDFWRSSLLPTRSCSLVDSNFTTTLHSMLFVSAFFVKGVFEISPNMKDICDMQASDAFEILHTHINTTIIKYIFSLVIVLIFCNVLISLYCFKCNRLVQNTSL